MSPYRSRDENGIISVSCVKVSTIEDFYGIFARVQPSEEFNEAHLVVDLIDTISAEPATSMLLVKP